MNGIDPPDPLAPEALALLDIDGSKQRAFQERHATSDDRLKNLTLQKLRDSVTHRTPETDARLDQLEAKYGLEELYGA